MSGVCWLASYPKSGNTWLRLLLQSYFGGGVVVDINAITLGAMCNRDRAQFDEVIGVAAADLTGDEIRAWRPAMFRAWMQTLSRPAYIKTHELRGEIAADQTAAAIYLVRDPRDVALSLARHMQASVDRAIAVMGTSDQRFGQSRTKLLPRLLDIWGSWSQNVESWLAPAGFPIHILRYETLRAEPSAALTGILSALGLPIDPQAVEAAIAATALETLRAQEDAHGFGEWPGEPGFFGDGRVQGWRDCLTSAQIARIEADHGPTMQRLGYLGTNY